MGTRLGGIQVHWGLMLNHGSVAITIVTYNSGRFIWRCLESVLEQQYGAKRIFVTDNASTDGTREILEWFKDRITVVYNEENVGFAAAQNQAIAMSDSEWILALNPDVLLMPGFISTLVSAGDKRREVGTLCGKLLKMSADFQLPSPPAFDSTGIIFTPTMRHFDRGNGAVDRGDYNDIEYVFGSTGAAALYRREMISDVSVAGEFYDPDFFVYREDADVAWRAQLLGWRCLYVPNARAYHVRMALPNNRKQMSRDVNMHSVKNRFLLRIKNITPRLYRRHWMAITSRDCIVVAGCLFRERYSLKAFGILWKTWSRTVNKRRQIMKRRRAPDEYMEQWFAKLQPRRKAEGIAGGILEKQKTASG
jgi:GT2 family glycosyltransferase